jgi:[acyl-carrier-protein] S-malonyltransferase
MTPVAFLFPGQGTQYPGMGRDLYENFPVARDTFDEASSALGIDVAAICFRGDHESLRRTRNTRVAVCTTSVAALRALNATASVAPAFVAGHSLGEYTALVAAGAVDFSSMIRVVYSVGEAMELIPGSMAAILFLERAMVERACREAAEGAVLVVANYNSPSQVVISGDREAVERGMTLAKQYGAWDAVGLPVGAPCHCALMDPVRAVLERALSEVTIRDLRVPLVSNVGPEIYQSATRVRPLLLQHLCGPVAWEEAVRLMIRSGARAFVELGPGRLLSGLCKRISRQQPCFNVEDAKGVREAEAVLRRAWAA